MFVTLEEAIRDYVRDGDVVALEGFTHLIPFAAGHEIIRQGRRRLTLVRMTPDLIYDQLVGAGCAERLVFSWAGNPGVGSLHRVRDAFERRWPRSLELEEHTHAGMAAAYVAGAANLPFAVLRGYRGTDLGRFNSNVRTVACPFTGEQLSAVPALRPDVAVVHAQQADRNGNVFLWGIVGVQKEAVFAARRAVVTVEEIVEAFSPKANGLVIPRICIDAIALVPGGASPSYAQGYYERDNAAYVAWDAIAREREHFKRWLETTVGTSGVDPGA